MIHGLNSLIYVRTDVHLVLGRKGNEDNMTAVRVGTNGVITMVNKGLSKNSLAYYRAVCPMCVMTVNPSCSQFWNCCIVQLCFGKKFSSLCEAEAFVCGCHQVKYEKSFIDF